VRQRRYSRMGRLASARATRSCVLPRHRDSAREVLLVAAQAVRLRPHVALVPRRRAHTGDGRAWSPVRSAR